MHYTYLKYWSAAVAVGTVVLLVAIPGSQRLKTQAENLDESLTVVETKADDEVTVAAWSHPIQATFDNIPAYPQSFRPCKDQESDSFKIQVCQYTPSHVREQAWNVWKQGEYVGPHRAPDVPVYRLRVDDQLQFIYRSTRKESGRPYKLNLGDEVQIESITNPKLNRGDLANGRGLEIQPDGTIYVPLIGQVRAAGLTVTQLQQTLETRFKEYYRIPGITVTPLKVNTRLNELLNSVDRRAGVGGIGAVNTVSPDGTVQLVSVGNIYVQGHTLEELRQELNARYAQIVEGIEVMPVLQQRAPSNIYVLGEVASPGQFTLQGPTSAIQAIALAGNWLRSGNMRNVIVFRRTADWGLIATRIDLYQALYGRDGTPKDDIWLRDSDIVLVPRHRIQEIDDWIDLIFTQGIYGVVPLQWAINFSKVSTI